MSAFEKIKHMMSVSEYLESQGIDTSRAFCCINPDHDDHSPSMSIDPTSGKAHCFSCSENYDLLDCVQILEGAPDSKTAALLIAERFGKRAEIEAELRDFRPSALSDFKDEFIDWDAEIYADGPAPKQPARTPKRPRQPLQFNTAWDFTKSAETASQALYSPQGAKWLDYLHGRGFDDETIKSNRAGYCKNWDTFTAGKSFTDKTGKTRSLSTYSASGFYNLYLPYIGADGKARYILAEINDREMIGKHPTYKDRSGQMLEMKRTVGKYEKPAGGFDEIYNERYLMGERGTAPRYLYIVEGIYDAWSIEQAGREFGAKAIALVGASGNVDRLGAIIEEYPTNTVFMIGLDNDEAGKKGADRLAKMFRGMGYERFILTPPPANGNKSDWNEALQKNPDGLRQYLAKIDAAQTSGEVEAIVRAERPDLFQNEPAELPKEAGGVMDPIETTAPAPEIQTANGPDLSDAEKKAEAEKAARIATVENASAANHLQDFIDGISASANTPCIPTGFELLDEALDGGFYPGLYIIGAVSSLGKTTFTMQIADQIARSGRPVMIFSLEMARSELISKSISRLTVEACNDTGTPIHAAKTARGIMAGQRWADYSEQDKAIIFDAINRYSEYAENLYIYEALGDIGAKEIRQSVIDFIKVKNPECENIKGDENDAAGLEQMRAAAIKPVVIIDYLQILKAEDTRASDKQNTDRAVLMLKKLSRDLGLPVWGVSSFNRENYATTVNEAAFKESGAIEYTSDVLIGLQFFNTGMEGFDVATEKAQDPRDIELRILKNRNGRTGVSLAYAYKPQFNLFIEDCKVEYRQTINEKGKTLWTKEKVN